jgi:HPt (histidine-containing phosphotransfer) domain-containing protein
MPVMDGVEAAELITKLNTGTPIIAMTANVMTGEIENYKKKGMTGCLGKPFTVQELWRTLLTYLPPIESKAIVNKEEQIQEDLKLHNKLCVQFIKSNKDKFTDINDAIEKGDIKTAHRLAHSLKGNAGQIGKTELQKAALTAESLLKEGTVCKESLKILGVALSNVIDELKPFLENIEKRQTITSDSRQAKVLYKKLLPMLENLNPECLNLIDEVREIEGSEELANQIEEFNLESAAETLKKLMK